MRPRSLFFFYGSLRTGYWNNTRMFNESSAAKVADAKTVLPFQLYVGTNGMVPTAVPGGDTPIVGEVWSLNPDDAERVYQLESGYKAMEINAQKLDDSYPLIVEVTLFGNNHPDDCRYLRGGYVVAPGGDYANVVSVKREWLL